MFSIHGKIAQGAPDEVDEILSRFYLETSLNKTANSAAPTAPVGNGKRDWGRFNAIVDELNVLSI